MTVAFVPKESDPRETRVAASPDAVRKLVATGLEVTVEAGAGASAFFADTDYVEAGARIVSDEGWAEAELILKVQPVHAQEAVRVPERAVVVSFLVPADCTEVLATLAERRVTVFSMNLIPRTTRAQKMDALSSQANIAGYVAAVVGAQRLPRYFPLMMTAAGTIKPAVVVVMGAGVAGLQAIATCRRLGAQVWATDVRLAAKEQVASVGGRFIDVPGMEDLEDERGYAKQATPEFLALQRQIVGDKVAEADVVITTALVAGRKAPVLVPTALVERMRPGSVIVDLAARAGGNCELTRSGETVTHEDVTIVGTWDLAATMPTDASELYGRNVAAFVELLVGEGPGLAIDYTDEIVSGALVGEPPAGEGD